MVRKERKMDVFRKVVDDCGFFCLGFRGDLFTWQKGAIESIFVRERFDRGFVDLAWSFLFFNFKVFYFVR